MMENAGQSSIQEVDPNISSEGLSDSFTNFIFQSIISADNYTLDEETKQKIIARYQEHTQDGLPWINWERVLAPIEDDEIRYKYVILLDGLR